MKIRSSGRVARSIVAMLSMLAFAQLPASRVEAGAKVFDSDDFSLELGMRIQGRMEFMWPAPVGVDNVQRDFMIRRARLKMNGKMLTGTYGFEWKLDGTDQIGSTPAAAVENAWFRYPLGGGVDMRMGLYDQPFSRDRLTSDSKQLAVDRGAVSNVPEALGLADNAVGFELHGKPRGGRAEYTVGVYDNVKFSGALQDVPMVGGRLDLNFGATKDIYQDAHFGNDKWYSIGINGNYQGGIENLAGLDEGRNGAAGIDGMMDVPVRMGRLLVRGEANVTQTRPATGGNTLDTKVWMLAAGLLVMNQHFQPFVRFDEVMPDDAVGGGVQDITLVGANFYQKGHNLKIQGDVRLQSGGESVDGGRLQAQIDF